MGRLPLDPRDREVREEIRFHLEERARELEAQGVPAAEARRIAETAFGDVDRVTDRVRRVHRPLAGWRQAELWASCAQDVASAGRSLLRAPGFSAVAVLTLAIGIGASTALFAAADRLILQRLPVPEPERLVLLGWSSTTFEMASSVDDRPSVDADRGLRTSRSFSTLAYQRLRETQSDVADVFAFARLEQLNVSVDGQAEIASGQLVSGGYYAALGVRALVGRTLGEQDDRAAADAVVVLGHSYWQRRFGVDPGVIGSTIVLNGLPFTVVGITPEAFDGALDLGESPDVSVPLAFEPALRGRDANFAEPWNWWLFVMARLRDHETGAALAARGESAFQQAALAGWEALPPHVRSLPEFQGERALPHLEALTGSRGLADSRGTYAARLRILAFVVAGLLVIACANVAGLLLARAEGRQREAAIRSALGASRARVMRQWMAEGLLLALGGAAAGALVAHFAGEVLSSWVAGAGGTPAAAAALDLQTLAAAVTLALVTGVGVAAAPALTAWATRGTLAVRQPTGSAPVGRATLRGALAVAQVGFSFALLTTAGLLVGTLQNLEREELGFDPDGLLLFRLDPRLSGYTGDTMFDFYEALIERVEAVPGVRAATASRHPLLAGSYERTGDGLFVRTPDGQVLEGKAYLHRIRWSFFDVMDVPLESGRAFTPRDDASSPPVAIVNRAFADAYFADRDALGGRFSFGSPDDEPFEIVGLAGDAKYTGQRDAVPPTVYVPYLQAGPTQMSFAVRATGDAGQLIGPVRAALREVDPNVPMFDVRLQTALAHDRLAAERRLAWLSSLTGALALLLTCVALYGTVSWRVSRRAREIGVRMALGARAHRVLASVLGETALLVAGGLSIGWVVSAASSRLVAQQLFEVDPGSAVVRVAAAALLLLVALAAAFLPARRASHVDPATALRHD